MSQLRKPKKCRTAIKPFAGGLAVRAYPCAEVGYARPPGQIPPSTETASIWFYYQIIEVESISRDNHLDGVESAASIASRFKMRDALFRGFFEISKISIHSSTCHDARMRGLTLWSTSVVSL